MKNNFIWIALAGLVAYVFLTKKSTAAPTGTLGVSGTPPAINISGLTGLAPQVQAGADQTAALVTAGGNVISSLSASLAKIFSSSSTPAAAKPITSTGSGVYSPSYLGSNVDTLYSGNDPYLNFAPLDTSLTSSLPADLTFTNFNTALGL